MPNLSGIWTVTQQMQAKGQSIWPAVPGAPTSVTGTAGNAQVSVAFTAPSDAGYPATITSYTATSSPGGFTASGSSSPLVITGLTNGTAYTFTVTATNATGTGPASSPSGSVTPVAPAWLATFGDAASSGGGSDSPYGTYVDSSGNVYIVGEAVAASTQNFEVSKYNAAGVIQWQYRYGSSSGLAYAIAADSSGDLYVSGEVGGTPRLYKLNSSGAIQWQKSLNSPDGPRGIQVKSNGNIILQFNGSTPYPMIAELNSTGSTVNWVRQTSASGQSSPYNCVVVASSGNIYVAGSESAGGSSANWRVIKYDSSGTIQWKRRTTYNNNSSYVSGIAIDSSENVYITGTTAGTPNAALHKLDSSGNFQWAVTFANVSGGKVQVDSTGSYVYVTGVNNYAQFIAKFNSSGTVQYQRTMTLTYSGNVQTNSYSNIVVTSDFMYTAIAGYLYGGPGGNEYLIEKLPLDGSKTGTYTVGILTAAYAASSITLGTWSDNWTTASYTDTAGSLSTSGTGDSATATSITSSTTTL